MARYYVAGIPFDDENCLKHYGVKGMKWDQHLFGPDANTKYINWMNDIGKFTNKAANGVGSAVTNAAKTVGSAVNKGANFVTGNQARQNLNAAKNANPADPNYQAKVNRYQGQYNQTLPGMAGQAAQNATNWVNQAGDNVRNGNVANAVSGAVTNAADAVGDWTRGAAQNAGSAITNAGNAVGDWAGQAAQNVANIPQNIANWYTGNDVKAEAEHQRLLGNSNQVHGNDLMSAARDGKWNSKADQLGAWDEGLNKYLEGGRQLRASDSYMDMYNNAPQQRLNSAIQDATNWVNQAGDNVRNGNVANAVGNAANQVRGGIGGFFDRVGDWGRGAVNDVGNAVTNAGNAVGDWTRGAVNDATNWVNQAGDNVRNGNVANAITDVYNNSPVLGGLDRAALGAVQNAGNWIGDRARDAGNAVGNFVDSNITGNTQRQNAEMYNRIAQNPNADSVARTMNQMAANNAQANADATLFGRVGNAANAVGDWAGQAARNVGGAVTNAGNAAGDWVNQAGDNVRNWIDDRFINHSSLDDKPEGVTDVFWSNYVASGGTREQYEHDWK